MKLLHVIERMDPNLGGVCQAIRTSIIGLHALGVQNEVLSLDAPEAAFLNHDNFPVHAIGPGKGPWSYSAKLIPWLTDNLNRFDVVLIHGLWLYPSYAVKKAFDQYGQQQGDQQANLPKLYIMPHGMLDPYFQKAAGRKLKAIRNWVYWKLIESKVINAADGLLFTCEQERQLAREPFHPYKPKSEMVVGMGVQSPPIFEPTMQRAFLEQCPEVEGQTYILFLSRIHNKKGVELLIKAYEALTQKQNKTSTSLVSFAGIPAKTFTENSPVARSLPHLVIAGPGLDTPYGARMKELVLASEELKNKVHFPGMLTGQAKWGAFYGCKAFILPSHQENFGIAVAEALACSKPVLISNQVNIWREIEATGGGIIASDTQTGTMQLLEEWQALSGEEKKQMAYKAKNTYEKNFALGAYMKNLNEAMENTSYLV